MAFRQSNKSVQPTLRAYGARAADFHRYVPPGWLEMLKLSTPSIKRLQSLINEETTYRSGPDLIEFFEEFGFRDEYGQGFPSRWFYTEERLGIMNERGDVADAICSVLAPRRFVGRLPELDQHIRSFNEQLVFEKARVVRRGIEVDVVQMTDLEVEAAVSEAEDSTRHESVALSTIPIDSLGLDEGLSSTLRQRAVELERCLAAEAPLASIWLAGSILEGILIGVAQRHPKNFASSSRAPKDQTGKVLPFRSWKLMSLIEVARDIGLFSHDTHQFGHALRGYRNFIHPSAQTESGFAPRLETAKLSHQVLATAVSDVIENREKLKGP